MQCTYDDNIIHTIYIFRTHIPNTLYSYIVGRAFIIMLLISLDGVVCCHHAAIIINTTPHIISLEHIMDCTIYRNT